MPELHARELFPATEATSTTTRSTGGVSRRTLIWMTAIPLALLAGLTLACMLTRFDLWVTQQFFHEGHFPYYGSALAEFLYHYGPWPGIVFGIGCLVLCGATSLLMRLAVWRKEMLFLTLAVLIGPVILINGTLKPGWDRPRPVSIEVFGGRHQYVPPGVIGGYEKGRSFPSGHASMGYVFLLPAFLLLRKYPQAAATVFAVGFLLGAGIGLSRVAEGRHFLSDIVWSGAIVYFTGLALYVAMRLDRGSDAEHPGAPAATVPFARGGQVPANSDQARSNSAA